MKKKILILNIFLIFFQSLSFADLIYLQKDESIILFPFQNPKKQIFKIYEALKNLNFKKAKKNLYNLKLEYKDKKDLELLEAFIEFLENGNEKKEKLIAMLDLNDPYQKQIQAEILWMEGEKIRSFKSYSEIMELLSECKSIFDLIKKRIRNYCLELNESFEKVLIEGDFLPFCNEIKVLDEKMFKDENFYKIKCFCSLIEEDHEEFKKYFELIEFEERKFFEPFYKTILMGKLEKLKFLKEFEFNERQKKLAIYLYNKAEDEWLLENAPIFYKNAYYSKNLKVKELALLFCLYFPQIKAEKIEFNAGLEEYSPEEIKCYYPLILGNILKKDFLENFIKGEDFIFFIKKFISYLNLINPCERNWENYVNCGIIPKRMEKEKIEGEMAAEVIKNLKGKK